MAGHSASSCGGRGTGGVTKTKRRDEIRLRCEPANARAARRFVVHSLHARGAEDLGELAELLTSELVTNSILHANTAITVRLTVIDQRLRVEVVDHSLAQPSPRHFGVEAATGRGLELVEMLASSWGVDMGDGGKTVWFELESSDDRAIA
jgi:anti-sigma regulatory factor (Ser/Thr protein kinase)